MLLKSDVTIRAPRNMAWGFFDWRGQGKQKIHGGRE